MTKKIFKKIGFGFLILILFFNIFFFVGKAPQPKKIIWGVNFSQKHSWLLGLDWRENYLALLDDLKIKNLKILVHWDNIEREKDRYFFDDLDWQINEAEKRKAQILLVMGIKTGRWPECHIPDWAKNLSQKEQQKEILEILREIVLRYKNSEAISMWQVENEPFFPFGECPWSDKKFLNQEIKLVKSLDPLKRPIVVSDSGEASFWLKVGYYGDIVGITMYRKVWFSQLKTYVNYPFPAIFYWRKAQIIKTIFNKKVMVVELQAEPWGKTLLYDSPLAEQEKTMNLDQFRYNIEFAKKSGFDTIYLWGGEWWFWLKKTQNDSRIWDEARNLFIAQ